MALFPLGRLTCTIGALRVMERLEEFPYLTRHRDGDWGDLGAYDGRENDKALRLGHDCLASTRRPKAGCGSSPRPTAPLRTSCSLTIISGGLRGLRAERPGPQDLQVEDRGEEVHPLRSLL